MINLRILTENLPIKSWATTVEEGAIAQAKNLANLPFTFEHVALMPDVHQGYGMPIGGVLATRDVVIPNAVGVDIGCGMAAVQLDLTADQVSKEALKKVAGKIRGWIPLGTAHQSNSVVQNELMPSSQTPFVLSVWEAEAVYQLGTLGGGNHFIEIQKDQDGHIWIMVHSGSRNLGKKVADLYNKMARSLNKLWYSSVDDKQQLAFLPAISPEGILYLQEMRFCKDFARLNRRLIIEKVFEVVTLEFPEIQKLKFLDVAHNYVEIEHHFGYNVFVHRKGAIRARRDDLGIIPGSQGTKSYIVKGLGNPESFDSCSHGAGRVMSRTRARETLCLKDQVKILDDQGIVHGLFQEVALDEAPGAYKDIATVMQEQEDLVEILYELLPMAVVKA